MKFTMLGNANQAGPVRLSDVYTSNVGDASMGIAASQKALYQAYNSLNSSKLSRYLNNQIKDANDLLEEGVYFNISGIQNTPLTSTHNMLISVRSLGTPFQLFFPDNVQAFYKRHFTVSSSTWSTWKRFSPSSMEWETYLGFTTYSAASGSITHEQAIKNCIDGLTNVPKIYLVRVTVGSQMIYMVQKYGTVNYASYIGINYGGSLVIGKKSNGTWAAQKTVATC